MILNNLFEKRAKLRYFPLTMFNFKKLMAAHVATGELKGSIE
jgi:hypothetical protein